MEHGRIVEQGTHEELLELRGRYWDLYRDWAEQAAAVAATRGLLPSGSLPMPAGVIGNTQHSGC